MLSTSVSAYTVPMFTEFRPITPCILEILVHPMTELNKLFTLSLFCLVHSAMPEKLVADVQCIWCRVYLMTWSVFYISLSIAYDFSFFFVVTKLFKYFYRSNFFCREHMKFISEFVFQYLPVAITHLLHCILCIFWGPTHLVYWAL